MITLLFLIALESSYFLRMSPGVMSQGLGGSSVVVNEGLSVFHNPANVQEKIFNFTLSRWLYSTNYLTLGMTYDHYSFGLSYMNYGKIQGYDSFGLPTHVFTPYNSCIGFGKRFGPIGIALRGFVEQVADQTRYGIAGCLGFHMRYRSVTVGAKLDNLGKEFAEGTVIPYYTAIGFKFDLAPEISLITEAKYPKAEINSGIAYSYQNLTLLCGARYLQDLDVHQGFNFDDLGLTGGLMLVIDNYRIGYAFVYGYLSVAHQFNVTFAP
ncbi:MAG: hypothetical protein WBE28_04270 [bacterium]